MMKILAPVKDKEAAFLAINLKSDELYCSGPFFSARHNASISIGDLKDIIDYAHLYQVKVYITLNTIINNKLIDKVVEYIKELVSLGIDALIIQDLGLLKIISELYPHLEIHASTQMHLHNSFGIDLVKDYGVKRVVLARELSLSQIKIIKDKFPNLDFEAFIHGALCTSYSGQCYYGAFYQTGSGNKGTCEQYCRQKHQYKNDFYNLSLKDLGLLDQVQQLDGIVDSLKIEGRLKSKEYLYASILFYQDMIKGIFNEKMYDLMQVAFNRTYTKGFILNDQDEMLNPHKVNNHGLLVGKVVSIDNNNLVIKCDKKLNRLDNLRISNDKQEDGLVIERIEYLDNDLVKINNNKINFKGDVYLVKTRSYDQEIKKMVQPYYRKIVVGIKIEVKINQPLKVIINDKEYFSDFIVEKALKQAMNSKDIVEAFSKINDTPYRFEIDINDLEGLFIVKSQLNAFKRMIIDDLMKRDTRIIKEEKFNKVKSECVEFKGYKFMVQTFEQAKAIKEFLPNQDEIYVDNLAELEKIAPFYKDLVPVLPQVVDDQDFDKYAAMVEKYPRVMVSELGMLKYFQNTKIIETNFSLNIENNYALSFLRELGVCNVVLSVENNSDLKIENIQITKLRYGYLPLMVIKHQISKDEVYLTNSKNEKLWLKKYYHLKRLYSAFPLEKKTHEADYSLISFVLENENEVKQVLRRVL